MSLLSEKVRNLPAAPGVYLWKDARGKVLYVGKAKRLSSRVRSYLTGDVAHGMLGDLMREAADLDVILTDTEAEALLLESTLVRQHKPHFNTVLKDDKSFPYVKISVQEDFPRLSVTRRVLRDGARYIGPFTDVKRVRRILREIRRVFPVRTCRNFEDYVRADRPCLYYHIKRCVGPCYSRASVRPEEYRSLVEGLILFLTGRDQELLRRLRSEMDEASAQRRYEQAARRRDQIALLEKARSPQKVVARRGRDTDVIGVSRQGSRGASVILLLRGGRLVGKETRMLDRADVEAEDTLIETFLSQHYLALTILPRRIIAAGLPAEPGPLSEALAARAGHPVELVRPVRGREARLVAVAERNAALALEDAAARSEGRRARYAPEILELQKTLDLPAPPYRMVCFDVSNLGADQAVAAVVASENGRALKRLYRRMRIRRPGPDDFGMIAEAVERYWTRVESGELPRPDLVLIDGGAGQVGAARAALDRASTRPVPLLGLAKREETIVRERGAPLKLPRSSPSLRALQRLRDEAHRFGLAYHRKLRQRERVASALDAIAGIGPARRVRLLRAFGSVAAVGAATAAEMADRAGIPLSLAERVVAALGGPTAAPPAPAMEGVDGATEIHDAGGTIAPAEPADASSRDRKAS